MNTDFKNDNLWFMKGDCLERMKEIPDGGVDMVLADTPSLPIFTICTNKSKPISSMNEKVIIDLYLSGKTMRTIAKDLGTNHKLISRVLKRNGIQTRKPKNLREVKKFNCDIERNYNNMATHLRFDVTREWLMQFSDFDKLKLLNEAITNRDGRWDVSTDWYKKYIEKFYFDDQFNSVYSAWLDSGKSNYKKPSIDHVIPKAKGGTNDLKNLQFLSWFENRCKNDMSQEEWNVLKNNIHEYFV